MTTVSPSILASDFFNLESELKAFDNIENLWFHLDIMDGHFVPNTTFGHPILQNFQKHTTQKLDAHLMVSNPLFYVETINNMKIHNLTFHYESLTEKDILSLIETAKKSFPSVGISIKPNTPVSVVSMEIIKQVDLFLVMSVEPGFGGQSFMEDSYNKISELKMIKEKNNLTFEIQVDGGVSDKNAKQLIKSGATNLVAGSYIFKANKKDYLKKVNSLREE